MRYPLTYTLRYPIKTLKWKLQSSEDPYTPMKDLYLLLQSLLDFVVVVVVHIY